MLLLEKSVMSAPKNLRKSPTTGETIPVVLQRQVYIQGNSL